MSASSPVICLDTLRRELNPRWQDAQISLLNTVDSTNAWLARQSIAPVARNHVVIAKQQTQGQGQLGRQWLSPPGGLYLSVSPQSLTTLEGPLTLAIAVAISQSLRRRGLQEVGVKWPNDLYVNQRKLGGILCERRISHARPQALIVGIGINCQAAPAPSHDCSTGHGAAIALEALGVRLRLGVLAALVINAVLDCTALSRQALGNYVAQHWSEHDQLHGARITLTTPNQTIRGTATGIDAEGALCLATPTGLELIHSGAAHIESIDWGKPCER